MDNENRRTDALDFLIDGMQEIIEEQNADGTKEYKTKFNPKSAWYKGHIINQPFGRYALWLERLEGLAKSCYDNMWTGRAHIIAEGILRAVESHRRSIDAKSSETYRDERNTQSSLIHILTDKSIERKYTLKGDEIKKGLFAGMMGRRSEEDDARD